jgi:ribose transport system permease protein
MQNKLSKLFYKWDTLSVLLPILLLGIVFSVTTKGFLSNYNLQSLGRIVGVTAIVGLSQLCVLAIGHFNLALGSMACLSGMLTCGLMEVFGFDTTLAIVAGIVAGTASGYIQGFLIVKTGINPFIITLSLTSIYQGLTIGVTRGALYQKLPEGFKAIGKVNVAGIPVLLIIAVVFAVILFMVMQKSLVGRQLLAIGANPRAANFSGIEVGKMTITAHTLSGLLAAVAGILQVSRLGVGQSSVGADWMLISFAAPVLGGTLLSGGKVNIVGTLFGAVLMSIIVNGLIMVNISQYWFQAFMGLILLGAFEIDRVRASILSSQRTK